MRVKCDLKSKKNIQVPLSDVVLSNQIRRFIKRRNEVHVVLPEVTNIAQQENHLTRTAENFPYQSKSKIKQKIDPFLFIIFKG